MEFQDIIYEKKDRIARIIFNRPEVLNAMRDLTYEQFTLACADASTDTSIGVVVISGAGGNFSSGGDVRGYIATEEQAPKIAKVNWLNDPYMAVRMIQKPTIAMVRGWCIGGANVIAALCDMTIASETAKFGQNGPRMGSYNAWGFGYLARVVGEKKAREIWFLCRRYPAEEALEMGLANKVVPDDKLESEVEAWCQEILALSPIALRTVKLHFQADSDHYLGLWNIAQQSAMLYLHTQESQEGVKAFLEKRKPDFWKFY